MSDWSYQDIQRLLEAGAQGDSATVGEALTHPNWRVRYAAAIAAGDTRNGDLVEPLVELLEREDQDPLYSEPQVGKISDDASSVTASGLTFAAGTTERDIDAWERRGRVKQAAITSLGELGLNHPRVLQLLQSYVVDIDEDYMVRAASGKALGIIGDPAALPTMEQAAKDEEFCTRVEAQKAVRRLQEA